MTPIVNDNDIATLRALNPMFDKIILKYQVPPNWHRPPGFVTLSKLILEQQVSLDSAHAHFLKLSTFLDEFTPERILMLSDEEMRNCHISRQKAGYLRNLSTAILTGKLDLDPLQHLSDQEVRLHLTSLKGIGDWTTDVYLLFCLQRKDIFPIGDIAVVNTMKELTPAQTKVEILDYAESWRPLRSLATYLLWHYYLMKRSRTAPFELHEL
ncbi:MAG: DNA-3-methyladenine glycosylase 2 family protein [Pedobacter sp.]|nr:MAG: DNA-3-methyladenine glycosylase 2 family protein [Pedobacter sp.]